MHAEKGKKKKKITGEEINILQACQAHLSGARLAAWPLTHMIAWAAVHFLSVCSFFPPLSPRNCLFAVLLLSIVGLDEGEVCKGRGGGERRGAWSFLCERNTRPLEKKNNTTTIIIITAVSSDFSSQRRPGPPTFGVRWPYPKAERFAGLITTGAD